MDMNNMNKYKMMADKTRTSKKYDENENEGIPMFDHEGDGNGKSITVRIDSPKSGEIFF